RGDRREHRVGRQRGVSFEVKSRIEVTLQPTRKETDVDVRRLQHASVAGHSARTDRLEHAHALYVRRKTAEAAERVETALARQRVPAVRVSVIQLDEGV